LNTTDGGMNWIIDTTVDWGLDIQFLDPMEAWVSGRRKIARTTDGGIKWNVQFEMTGKNWIDIAMVDKQNG